MFSNMFIITDFHLKHWCQCYWCFLRVFLHTCKS